MKFRLAVLLSILLGLGLPASYCGRFLRMMVASSLIFDHIEATGQWPRSWEDLLSRPFNDEASKVVAVVVVDWDVTVEEIVELDRTREDWETRDPASFPRPLILRFTDVPRNESLEQNEVWWNLRLVERIGSIQPLESDGEAYEREEE